MNKAITDQLKAFGMTNQMLAEDLRRIESEYDIHLNHTVDSSMELEETYYPQFGAEVRKEAAVMSKHYEIIYCLERSIRDLVSETLQESIGTPSWWNTKFIPDQIKADVEKRKNQEADAAVTRRSEAELDYTTFGELSVIITSNWVIFNSLFSSQRAVQKVMASLNSLRGPIAHCTKLAEDEELRLRLSVRDWFRLLEE
jgi:hypothetical protein